MCFLILGRLVGKEKKIQKKVDKESGTRRPSTSAYLWSLETRRHGYKVNMAEEIDMVVKIKQEKRGKNEPKLHTDLPPSMTFQQLLERIVPDILHITATCRIRFKKRGEQVPTDFVEVQFNDSMLLG